MIIDIVVWLYLKVAQNSFYYSNHHLLVPILHCSDSSIFLLNHYLTIQNNKIPIHMVLVPIVKVPSRLNYLCTCTLLTLLFQLIIKLLFLPLVNFSIINFQSILYVLCSKFELMLVEKKNNTTKICLYKFISQENTKYLINSMTSKQFLRTYMCAHLRSLMSISSYLYWPNGEPFWLKFDKNNLLFIDSLA